MPTTRPTDAARSRRDARDARGARGGPVLSEHTEKLIQTVKVVAHVHSNKYIPEKHS